MSETYYFEVITANGEILNGPPFIANDVQEVEKRKNKLMHQGKVEKALIINDKNEQIISTEKVNIMSVDAKKY